MTNTMTIADLAVDHDYYASENNYYSNKAKDRFINWSDFYKEYNDLDVDLNLVYRWDIYKNSWGEYSMKIIIIQQRTGIYFPILIGYLSNKDVPQIIDFLKPHFQKLLTNWQPLSDHYLKSNK